jgi:hypothetical protein
MKTNSKNQNATSNNEVTKHTFMAMTGVLIAIICSLVLLRDITPANDAAMQFEVPGKSPVSIGHQVVKATTLSVIQ